MKKATYAVLVLCLILAVCMSFTACGHKCEFAPEWSSDELSHWHDCTDAECELTSDKADHTWDEGKITTEATRAADGVKTYTCTVCQATKTESVPYVHVCEFSTEWSYDETSHWHDCKDEVCELDSDKGEHTWNDGEITTKATQEADGVKTFTCTVCSATRTEAVVYTGMTKAEWEAVFVDALYENFSYKEIAEVKATGISVTTESLYKFTKDSAWVKVTIAGQSEEDTAPDAATANIFRTTLLDSIKAIASYDSYKYDADTKTYKATTDIFIASLGESTSNITLKFSDGKLVELNYLVEVERNGVKMSAEAITTFFDYGTTAVK